MLGWRSQKQIKIEENEMQSVNDPIPRGVLKCLYEHVNGKREEPYCHVCSNEKLCDSLCFIVNQAEPIEDRRL